MRVNVFTAGGEESGKKINLNPLVFDVEPSKNAIYSSVVAEMWHLKQGSRATKSKAQVKASGRKPWRQKGTGRARVGTLGSPIWKGGGHTFAIRPGLRSYKVNKKVKQLARKSAFSAHVKAGTLKVVEELNFETNKTSQMRALLKNFDINGVNSLLILKELSENILLSARNIPNLMVVSAGSSSTLDLVSSKKVILESGAVEILNKLFDKSEKGSKGDSK